MKGQLRRSAHALTLSQAVLLVACDRAGSMAVLSRRSGVDRANLQRSLSGRASLSMTSLVRIAEGLCTKSSTLLREAEKTMSARGFAEVSP